MTGPDLEARVYGSEFASGLLETFAGAALIALLVAARMGDRSELVSELGRGLPGFLLVVGASVAYLAFGLRRLRYYVPLFLVAALLDVGLGFDPAWSLLGPGVALLFVGIFLLLRFFRSHPRAEFE